MTNGRKWGRYIAGAVRWAARIYGVFMAVLILYLAVVHVFRGDGPGNPFRQPVGVAFELLGLVVIFAGLIIGWKWDGIGGLLIITGMLAYWIVERKLWFLGIFTLLEVGGVLYLLSWLVRKVCVQKQVREDSSESDSRAGQ